MSTSRIPTSIQNQITIAVKSYEKQRTECDQLGRVLLMHLIEDEHLRSLIHSGKFRIKTPQSLRGKLQRKARESILKSKPFTVTPGNLFKKIQDLVGVRILHLHTKQISAIHPAIEAIISRSHYTIREGPVGNTWDIETQSYFKSLRITTKLRDSMYTSVHYIVTSAERPDIPIELQVRTLMEEVWGEVSHQLAYPKPSSSKSCQEQLKVLARITSGCSRLVDSIYATHKEHSSTRPRKSRS